MKKTTRKLIAGTLLCTMAFSGMPALTYGDETFTYAHAAEAEAPETEAPVTEVSTTETPTTEQDMVASPEVQKQSSAQKIKIKITSKKANIKVGKSYQFRAVEFYTKEKLQWSVSDKKIASINKTTGKLKAKKAGKVTVTVTCNDVVKKLQVNVKK